MKEIMLTETVFAAAIMLTEIPSGYFADRVGRKISIVLGVLFWIVGICFYAFTFSFWWICLGALLWGIGTSFNSGADEAMLYETLVERGREKEYKKVSGNLFFYGRMASVAGGIMAGFMAADNIKMPAYATLFMVILWFFLSLTLHETRGEIKDKETWRHFKRVFYESIVVNKTLRYFLIFTAVGGFYGMEFWLNQRYWDFMGIPILYFGILVSGIAVFSGFAG
ncbi:MAG: MFS transporter, partial [Thermodesulfovibrionia bacterium]|nr:MFS transporter [Thermodesulfovibrionia bacterium]